MLGIVKKLKYALATVLVLASGWSVLALNGLRTTLEGNARGFHLYEAPAHPVLLGAVYACIALGFPLISAWLLTPSATGKRLWPYTVRLVISIACELLAALVIAFAVMASLDS